MSDSDDTDSLTKLNTTLNKSMAFMEKKVTDIEKVKLKNSRKSVSINTKENLEYSTNDLKRQKSILKKSEQVTGSDSSEEVENPPEQNVQPIKVSSKIMKRPLNLQSLKNQENLVDDFTKASFGLDDISDDDEIYIIDVPRTIDPKGLKGQVIRLEGKNKLEIGDLLYETCGKDPINISCIFRTDKEDNSYRAVNVRPAGWINVRQKLSKTSHVEFNPLEKRTVPFPENLKTRHPLFGLEYEEKITFANNIRQRSSRPVTKKSSIRKLNKSDKIENIQIKSESFRKDKNNEDQLFQKLDTSKNNSINNIRKIKKIYSDDAMSSDSEPNESFFLEIKQERNKKSKRLSNILNLDQTYPPTHQQLVDSKEKVISNKHRELSSNKKLASSLISFTMGNTSFDTNTMNGEFSSSTPIKIEKINENSEDEISMNKIKKRKNHSDIGAKVPKLLKKAKAN